MSRAVRALATGVMALATALPPLPAPGSRLPPVPRPVHHDVASRRESPETVSFMVTAYCPCAVCCGKSDGITATGRPARAGHTVAVDPALIPLGSRLMVESLGERVAEDVGGLIRGRRLDVYFPHHDQALAFGRRQLAVRILPASDGASR